MSVRESLLAILTLGPCYGYQLRAEYARRTGGARSLNVGQVYNTLERLERDGLATRVGADAHGHVHYAVTDAGRAAAASWFAAEDELPTADLAAKIALAATLPGVDVARMLAAQRDAAVAALTESGDDGSDAPVDGEAWARAVVGAAGRASARVRLAWLEETERLWRQHPPAAYVLELAQGRPRRGRPARSAS